MSICPHIQPSSIMSIYPPIQPASVYHVYLSTHSTSICLSCLSTHPFNHCLACLSIHPSVSNTYLFLLSIYVVYHLSICLSLLPIYLYVIHLIYQSIYVALYHLSVCLPLLSVYLYIYLCVYSSGSQLEMAMPLRGCMTRHGDIFYCQN